MSQNAAAIYVEGTISKIKVTPDSITIVMEKANGSFLARTVDDTLTTEQIKLFMASAMAAYSLGKTVVLSGPDSDWTTIQLK